MSDRVTVQPDGVVVGSGAAMQRYLDGLKQQAYERTVRTGRRESPLKPFADVPLAFACQGCGVQDQLLESGGNTGTRLWCADCYPRLREIERDQLRAHAELQRPPEVV